MSNILFAQQYSRMSITPLHLHHKSGSLSLVQMSDSVSISDRFDYNYYNNNKLNVNFDRLSSFANEYNNLTNQIISLQKNSPTSIDQIKKLKNDQKIARVNLVHDDSMRMPRIITAMNDNYVANKILATILIDPKLGYMTTDVIAKRAEYNASDADYLKAMNSETKMAAIRDKGLDMLKNVYVLVFDDKALSERSVDKNNPQYKSLTAQTTVYLFQVDVDSLIRIGQFDPLIFTENNPTKATAFASFNFPMKFIMKGEISGSTDNYKLEAPKLSGKAFLGSLTGKSKESINVKYVMKQNDQINKELNNSLFAAADFYFTQKYQPFQVKVNVFGRRPITAKIGKKEAIEVDELFKVTETVMQKDGKKVEKKVGWVRSKKIADNRKVADGKMDPSIFYKVSCKKVEKGMKLTIKKESGIVLGLGYNIGKDNVAAGPMFIAQYITHKHPGLRAALTVGGFGTLSPDVVKVADREVNSLEFKGTNIYGDVTGQKIFQANHLELTPEAGVYFSRLGINKLNGQKIPDEYKGLSNISYGPLVGIKFGVNFGPNAQLNVGYKYGFQIGSKLKDDKGDVTANNGDPVTMEFKAPSVITVGLRIYGF